MNEDATDPDCRAGKHGNCWGTAWSAEKDDVVDCCCSCHKPTEASA